ncbi:hypothetical protein NXX40_18645 [Parabacteroides distasonis]|nr:hypothetical protein [Parabacteroides distasonis]
MNVLFRLVRRVMTRYDGGVWQDFHRHQWQYNLDALNNVWISVFSGITTCNRVVYDLDTYKEEMDVDIYNKYRAETVILRCFYYSILLGFIRERSLYRHV